MITVPVSTPEKPLTAIDFQLPLAECRTVEEVGWYGEQVPMDIRSDERFTRAVAKRLAEIKGKQAAA